MGGDTHKGPRIAARSRLIHRRGASESFALASRCPMVMEQSQELDDMQMSRKQSMLKNPAMQT